MKKIIMFIALAIISLTMTGCFTSFAEVEWIEFVNSFDAVYTKGQPIDLNKITVRIKYTNGNEDTLKASNSAIVVTGVDTSEVGIKTARVTYRSISITAQYEVIPNTNFNAADAGAITAFTNELKTTGTLEEIVIEGVFEENFTIQRPVRIVGVKGAKIIGGFTIDNNIAEGTISFNNLKMEAPSVGTGNGISLSGGLQKSIDINVDACEFKNFDIGVIISIESGANIKAGTEKTIGNLTVKDTFFNSNTHKGLYVEGANNISITGTTFNSNATIGKSGSTYNAATRIACDINLKYATYNSVLIENCRFVNNGANPDWSGQYVDEGYTVTPYTAALGIKVRNDAGSYHNDGTRNVAVLNNLVVRNNRFENNFNGIYFGEPKTANVYDSAGNLIGEKAIQGFNEFGNVSLSGNVFVNNSQADIINCSTKTTIQSVVNSVAGLNNAILYSSMEDITIVVKNNLTVDLESYEGYFVNYSLEQKKFIADEVRTFDNLDFIFE